MLPDRVSNPGPLTYESGALPIALRGPAQILEKPCVHTRGHSFDSKLMKLYQNVNYQNI